VPASVRVVAIFESDTEAEATSIASALVGLASDGSSDGQSDGSVAAVATSVGFGVESISVPLVQSQEPPTAMEPPAAAESPSPAPAAAATSAPTSTPTVAPASAPTSAPASALTTAVNPLSPVYRVSATSMDFVNGVLFCSSIGMSIGRIDSEAALGMAQAAMISAGVEKAISGAYSDGDGSGWKWLGSDIGWDTASFPLNVGGPTAVSDQRGGMADGMYSVHSSGDLVWDADSRSEQHRVLCWSDAMEAPPALPPQTPSPPSLPLGGGIALESVATAVPTIALMASSEQGGTCPSACWDACPYTCQFRNPTTKRCVGARSNACLQCPQKRPSWCPPT